jgi:uncharacterized protein YfaS (alpha-2-macroglobulin family)
MNCDSVQEKLYELIFDLVDEGERREMEAHLKECETCRGIRDRVARQRERLHEWKTPEPPAGLAERTIALARMNATGKGGSTMKLKPVEPEVHWLGSRRFWKIAAAVLVFVCAGIGINSARVFSRHANPVEVSVYSQPDFTPGLPAAARVYVHDSHSGSPVRDARVRVSLKSKGRPTVHFADFRTNEFGFAQVEAVLPADASEGDYSLDVKVASDLGDTDVSRKVSVKRSFRTMITTDKPLYQPGQTIHVRTLSLATMDLKPVSGRQVVVEVADPKGNKVFKKFLQTSEYGIASADFELADQVNMGDYTISATIGDTTSERGVNVARYVLPKFRVDFESDRSYYMPGQTVAGELRAEYTFGKDVSGARVSIKANEFIEAFHTFATVEGSTDEEGRFHFSIPLKSFFAGQDLKKGDAIVQLEATVTDTAGHVQTKTMDLSVTERPIRIEVFPESGELVQNVENVLYIVTAYPDGRPAMTNLIFGADRTKAEMSFRTRTTTSDMGIAKVKITPRSEHLQLTVTAEDGQGAKATVTRELRVGERQDGFLVRADRAVYRTGETVNVEIVSASQTARMFLDIVKDRRTVLMKSLDVRNGRASLALDLPADLFGTLELHAYRVAQDGNIVRDSRVIQVTRADDLQIRAELDKETYRPGEEALVRFIVNRRDGTPAQAALGLAGVDEAVFALYDMRPGLEDVYFAIQEEILKPRYEIHARAPITPEQVIEQPVTPRPELEEATVVLFSAANDVGAPERAAGETFRAREEAFRTERKDYTKKLYALGALVPFGLFILFAAPLMAYSFTRLFRREPVEGATKKQLKKFRRATRSLMWRWIVGLYLPLLTTSGVALLTDELHWHFKEVWAFWTWSAVAAIFLFLIFRTAQRVCRTTVSQAMPFMRKTVLCLPWAYLCMAAAICLVAAAGTERIIDRDVAPLIVLATWLIGVLLVGPMSTVRNCALRRTSGARWLWLLVSRPVFTALPAALVVVLLIPAFARAGGRFSYHRMLHELPPPMAAVARHREQARRLASLAEMLPVGELSGFFKNSAMPEGIAGAGGTAGLKAPTRIRRHFPETLLWAPELITDAEGRAQLRLPLADSITTWRIAMSGVSSSGELGSATQGLRVFQDFFVDIDFPVALTQNDRVSTPVAVFNYLDRPQTVRLEIEPDDWYELLDSPVKELTIGPKEVTSVAFTLRALKPGRHALTVKAFGSEMGDAVRREVTVSPDGQPVVETVNGFLGDGLSRDIVIPDAAIDGANDLIVKIYPGSFSQVIEGMDSIFRMPFGCFEQTSSVTYPNILVLDYMRRTKQIKPDIEMKALNFINLGYQRLLSYEVKGGGFDWFGNPPAHNVLTAYGLMEFSDMAKVYEVDPKVTQRTGAWLLDQQKGDGSWEPSGGGIAEGAINAFQGATLRTTAYIAWALAQAGDRDSRLNKALNYVKGNASAEKDPYTLALCANCLIAADHVSDARAIIARLDEMKIVEDGLVHWTSDAQGVTYSRGNALDIETTALAAYAMLSGKQNTDTAHKALEWLVRQKDSNGTWHSTQATVHAMRALLLGTGPGGTIDEEVQVTVAVNGKTAKEIAITPETSDVFRRISLRSLVGKGHNRVDIKTSGKGNLAYQIVGTHYLPWPESAGPKAAQKELEIDVTYDTTTLSQDELLTSRVTVRYNRAGTAQMTIVDLGIPPGFVVQTDAFEELKTKGVIERYSLTGRQVILYFREIRGGEPISFRYQLRAKFPVRAKTPSSKVYQYYEPEVMNEAAPVVLTVL